LRRGFIPRTEVLEGRTVLSSGLVPGLEALGGAYPHDLTQMGGSLFFAASDNAHGTELWKTDGTPAGTQLVKDINTGLESVYPGAPLLPAGSDPGNLTAVGPTLFFTADDGAHETELWKSDGTADGTVLVKSFGTPIDTGDAATDSLLGLHDLTDFQGRLFFTADDPVYGHALWASDGTATGTEPVMSLDASPSAALVPADLTVVNDQLFFAGEDGAHGPELWVLDGAADAPRLVKEINPAVGGSDPTGLTAVDGLLFFTADDGSHGRELWTSDGTAVGTTLVADINSGAGSSLPSDLVAFAGKLFFTADDGIHGRQLWESDGTPAGTAMVTDAAGGAVPADLTVVNDTLFFSASDGLHGRELWRSDGTQTGTILVRDINTGVLPQDGDAPASSDPLNLTAVDGALYFSADDGIHGRELGTSDGTSAGTVLVADLLSGPASAFPDGIVAPETATWLAVGNLLYFGADDGIHGFELWKLDTAPQPAASPSAPANATDLTALLQTAPAPTPVVPRSKFAPPAVAFSGTGVASPVLLPAIAPAQPGLTGLSGELADQPAETATDNHLVFSLALLGPEVSVGALALHATEGKAFDGQVASIVDPTHGRPDAQFVVRIDWGDGSTRTLGTVQRVGDCLDVVGRHTYRHPGAFAIEVMIEVDGVPLRGVGGTATVEPSLEQPPTQMLTPSAEFLESGPTSLNEGENAEWQGAGRSVALLGLILPLADLSFRDHFPRRSSSIASPKARPIWK
jgi:ELWxxDGT repeat protein